MAEEQQFTETSVTNPDGTVSKVRHPVGASDEEIIRFASENYTPQEQPQEQPQDQPQEQPERSFMSDVMTGMQGDVSGAKVVGEGIQDAYNKVKNMTKEEAIEWVNNNRDVPGGISGAAAGALLGLITAGPPGAVVGAFVGGMGGTGLGDLSSSAYQEGKEWNDIGDLEADKYWDAIQEAAISGGVDLVTMGVGRLAKPVLKNLLFKGVSAEEFIARAAKGEAADYGSVNAGAQTLDMLNKAGAKNTATPSQLGIDDMWGAWTENIARGGIWSGRRFVRAVDEAKTIAQKGFDSILKSNPRTGEFSSQGYTWVGNEFGGIIQQADKALGMAFGETKKKLRSSLETKKVNYGRLNKNLEDLLEDTDFLDAFGNTSPMIKKQLEAPLKAIRGQITASQGSASKLMELRSDITEIMSPLLNETKRGSPEYRRLSMLQKKAKSAVKSELQSVAPKAFKELEEATIAFAKGREALFPLINKNQVGMVADKLKLESIGRLAASRGDPRQITALKRSLKEGFDILKKNKTPIEGGVETYEAAELLMKRGYVSELLEGIQSGFTSVKDVNVVRLANKLTHGEDIAKAKAVLGDDFNNFKKTVNMLATIVQKPESQLFGLAQRSAEISKTAKAVTAFSGQALAAVTLVLGVPQVFARVLLNPKRSNILLGAALKQGKKPTKDYITEATTLIMNDVIKEMYADGMTDDEVDAATGGSQ